MIAYPAIDLRGGSAVQLIGGRTDAQKVTLPDPVEVAQRFADAGFGALHVVDLDAALAHGDNRSAIAEIIEAFRGSVHVGGGIRDESAIAEMLDVGAARVIVGTRAITDGAWRARAARRFEDRLIVAADVRNQRIVTHGWTRETAIDITTFVREVATEPLAALLITDVGREGRMTGVDVEFFENAVQASAHPVIAAGGIRDLDDLRALERVGVAGAVLGMSLYTGGIDAKAAAAEFS